MKKKVEKKPRRRATRHELAKRKAVVIQMMRDRRSKADICRMLQGAYSISKVRAYTLYDEAVAEARDELQNRTAMFVEHLESLRDCIRRSVKSEAWSAVAAMQAQLAGLLGFVTDEVGKAPVQVIVNNTNSAAVMQQEENLQVTFSPVARKLEEMSLTQLRERLSHVSRPAIGNDEPAAGLDGAGNSPAPQVVRAQVS